DLGRRCDGRVEPIDVNEVVRRASDLIGPEVRLQGISLRIDVASRLPSVFADPVQIEQVLLNLMLNGMDAVQATSQKFLTVQTARAGGEIYVSVCASGTGMQPELAERVFEPFFTTKSKGLGMGLAISRRIIEAHGGHLRAAMNPGGAGSTFSFSLPVA